MRIDDLNLNRTANAPAAEQIGQTTQHRAAEKSTAASSDQADVSQLAQSLATNPSRIDQLRLQVQSGSYNVSAEAVASALIDAHLTS